MLRFFSFSLIISLVPESVLKNKTFAISSFPSIGKPDPIRYTDLKSINISTHVPLEIMPTQGYMIIVVPCN